MGAGGALAAVILVIGYVAENHPTPLDILLDRSDIRLEVESGPGVRGATIEACGRVVELRGGETRRHAKVRVDCETSGPIDIVFVNGTHLRCHAGYLVGGMSERVVVRDGVCPSG